MSTNEELDVGTLYTTGEAAELLRVSRSSVYRWVERGQLGFFRLGERGDIRIAGAHLSVFLREYRSTVDAEQAGLAASGFYDAEDDE